MHISCAAQYAGSSIGAWHIARVDVTLACRSYAAIYMCVTLKTKSHSVEAKLARLDVLKDVLTCAQHVRS